jgi:hypothetical protein
MPALEKSPSEGAATTAISHVEIFDPRPAQNGH